MERLYVYLLNVVVISVLISCKEQSKDFSKLTAKEKEKLTNHYAIERGMSLQGSLKEQKYADSLILLHPEVAKYYQGKSIGLSKIGDYHKAFPLLEKALALNPDETLYYLSWLMTDLYKDYDRALKYLEQYDAMTPDKADYAWGNNVNFLKGEILQATEKHHEAIVEFSKAITEEGIAYVDVYAIVYRGISYAAIGEYKKAIADYDQSLRLYDKGSMAYYYKGLSLWELGEKEKAIVCIEEARRLILQGYKKKDPYKEAYNEIYLMQVEDKLEELNKAK